MARVAMVGLAAGVVAVLFAMACGDGGNTGAAGSEQAEKVALTDGDDGKAVELKVGQVLEITLEANPTTGFGWQVLEVEGAVVEQQGEKAYKQRETDGRRVGVGGWETFTFKAAKAGTADLRLVYRRSWEKDVEPAKTFAVKVTVKE